MTLQDTINRLLSDIAVNCGNNAIERCARDYLDGDSTAVIRSHKVLALLEASRFNSANTALRAMQYFEEGQETSRVLDLIVEAMVQHYVELQGCNKQAYIQQQFYDLLKRSVD